MDLLLNRLSIKRFIYLLFIASIVFTLHYKLNNSQVAWLVWATFLLSLITLGHTFWHRIGMISLTGIFSAIAVFFAGYLASSLFLLSLYLFMVTVTSLSFRQQRPHYFFPAVIVNVFAILAAILPVTGVENGERVLFIIISTVIVVLFQFIFLPYFKRDEMQFWLMIAIHHLNRLCRDLFICLLQPAYPEDLYLYEKRLHDQKNKYMQAVQQLYAMTQSNKKSAEKINDLNTILLQLDQLYDNVLGCAQLRQRVSDYTTLSLCEKELTDIANELNQLFKALGRLIFNKDQEVNTQLLLHKIKRLEENYQNVLQIAAREPLIFLLFIFSLKALSEKLDKMAGYLRLL